MHHLLNVFDLRKNSKKMDQTPSPRRKLHRKNAVKNFDYIPSASTSPSASSPPAHRTRSLELSRELHRTSIRIDGSRSDINSIIQSLGFSSPDDFGIPLAAWDARKDRSSSDGNLGPEISYSDDDKPEEIRNRGRDHSFVNDDKTNNAIEDKTGNIEPKLCEATLPLSHVSDPGHVGRGGIKGHRPPSLTPPPVMILPVPDDGCSTWDLFRGLAPDCHGSPISLYLDSCQISGNDAEGALESAVRENLSGVRIGETIIRSGSCSFTTNDDDSSSTTTEPLSIISPNGGCTWSIKQWDKGKLIGRGSFGTVYEGFSREGNFFAVKEVSLLEQGNQAKQSIFYLEQEIELLSQFQHENIVRYLGTAKDESNLYIFLELVTQGSLATLYDKYHLRDSHVCAYTRQILLGLKYLHDKNVIHRDIKCANILVGADGTVKLADFGLAKATKLNDLRSCKGTAFWMAPEVVNHKNQGYGLAADIWSLGCTVLEMLTGHVPYHPMEFMRALFLIGQGKPPPIPDSLSRDAKDLIEQCLCVNPKDRPTASELLEHPFVQRPLYAQAGFASPMPSRY